MPIIQIGYRGVAWMNVFPTKDGESIGSVAIISPNVESVWSTKIGMSLDKTYSKEQLNLCELGSKEFKGSIICKEALSEKIYYLYGEKSGEQISTMPLYKDLNKWVVDEIIWINKK